MSLSTTLKKRDRATNFTKSEVDILMDLVNKHKSIVDNKRNDTASNKIKEETWQKIANLFNASNGFVVPRTPKTLKFKYEGIKKEAKKRWVENFQDLNKSVSEGCLPQWDLGEKEIPISPNAVEAELNCYIDKAESPVLHTSNNNDHSKSHSVKSAANLKKRDRATNFSPLEVKILLDLVCKYKAIVDNKKNDAITNKKKEETWRKIANSFNSRSGTTELRSTKTLKLKYEGIKKHAKKSAQSFQELFAGEDLHEDERENIVASSDDGETHTNWDMDKELIPENLLEPKSELNDSIVSNMGDDKSKQEHGEEQDPNFSNEENNSQSHLDISDRSNEPGFTWTPQLLRANLTQNEKNKSKQHTPSKMEELVIKHLNYVQQQIILISKEIELKQIEHTILVQQTQEEHLLKMEHLRQEENRRNQLHELQLEEMLLRIGKLKKES